MGFLSDVVHDSRPRPWQRRRSEGLADAPFLPAAPEGTRELPHDPVKYPSPETTDTVQRQSQDSGASAPVPTTAPSASLPEPAPPAGGVMPPVVPVPPEAVVTRDHQPIGVAAELAVGEPRPERPPSAPAAYPPKSEPSVFEPPAEAREAISREAVAPPEASELAAVRQPEPMSGEMLPPEGPLRVVAADSPAFLQEAISPSGDSAKPTTGVPGPPAPSRVRTPVSGVPELRSKSGRAAVGQSPSDEAASTDDVASAPRPLSPAAPEPPWSVSQRRAPGGEAPRSATPRRKKTEPAEPRVHIGQVDVVVVSQEAPKPSRKAAVTARTPGGLSSRRYLRSL